jgi:hypothetical protein
MFTSPNIEKDIFLKPVAIFVNGTDDSSRVQEKLFSLGCGHFTGRYPLKQEPEHSNCVCAIYVPKSGRISFLLDGRVGNATICFAQEFIDTDFSKEKSRIKQAIVDAERIFNLKDMLYKISRLDPRTLTVEQMDLIEKIYNQTH